jgi:hypothetical protein
MPCNHPEIPCSAVPPEAEPLRNDREAGFHQPAAPDLYLLEAAVASISSDRLARAAATVEAYRRWQAEHPPTPRYLLLRRLGEASRVRSSVRPVAYPLVPMALVDQARRWVGVHLAVAGLVVWGRREAAAILLKLPEAGKPNGSPSSNSEEPRPGSVPVTHLARQP